MVVFNESGVFQHRIGDEKITCFPNGIDISDAGDILIGDSHGNRFHVACFSRSGELQSEFECPYVKVSVLFNDIFIYFILFDIVFRLVLHALHCRIIHFGRVK